MIPIIELLNKIKWDPREVQDEYKVGYLDRVQNKLIQIPVSEIEMSDKFSFVKLDNEGNEHNIPFHRIKVVWKNEVLIWERK